MSILSEDFEEEFWGKFERYAGEVDPVVKEFDQCYEQGVLAPVLIDPLKEVKMHAIASNHSAKYYDMATASRDDYNLVARSLANYDAYILDNIDKIAEGPQKEYFEELVRFMLKREDDFELFKPIQEKDFQVSGGISVNFSEKKIGARCAEVPQYLIGKSTYARYLRIPSPGESHEDK